MSVDDRPTMARRDWLMLGSYVPVHAVLDIIVLTNFEVPESSIYVVFVVNVALAFAIVWLVFWAFDQLRPHAKEPRPEG